MIKNDCDHEWKKMNNGKYTCSKCNEWILSSEVLQLEAVKNQTILIKHQLGFQKWLSVLAFIISIVAVIIAATK